CQVESARTICPYDAPSGMAIGCTCRACALRDRERELLTGPFRETRPLWNHFRLWAGETLLAIVPDGATMADHLAFRRGFVASITLTTQAFLDHAAELFCAAPIEEVRLSDARIRDNGRGQISGIEFPVTLPDSLNDLLREMLLLRNPNMP